MTIESLLSMSGLGKFIDQDFFVAQIGLLGGSALLFILSLVLCIMAFRAAMAARNARSESEAYFESAQDLAKEVRLLTAQVEKTMSGERTPLAGAATGIAAASVPDASINDAESGMTPATEREESGPVVTSSDGSDSGDASEVGVADARSALRAPQNREGENTLSFVDGDESLLRHPDPGFVGEGISPGEFNKAPAHDLAARDSEGEAPKPSPLSSLLRRRRF